MSISGYGKAGFQSFTSSANRGGHFRARGAFSGGQKKEVESLREAVAAKDFEAIELFAHRIKGVGKMYGFPIVTDIGQRLEVAAKEKNKNNAKTELAAMYLYLCEVKIMKKVSA